MLLDLIESNILKIKAMGLAATIAVSLIGCGDECDKDSDCPKGEYCAQHCEMKENCSAKALYCVPTETCYDFCTEKTD